MSIRRKSVRTIAHLAIASSALSLASAALAQNDDPAPMSQTEIDTLPPEYRTAPTSGQPEVTSETTIGPDGVETVTRTRRIGSYADTGQYDPRVYEYGYSGSAATAVPGGTYQATSYGYPHPAYAPIPYAPQPMVFERSQWVEECERRVSAYDEKDRGGVIGLLLGALAGGFIGNRVADGDRLAGTLIGAGGGALAGLAIEKMIDGGKKDGAYDCEAALDAYLSQYGSGQARFASRTIPAPAYAYPAYAPHSYYSYGYAPVVQSYSYAAPQQVVLVPVEYQQQQRVVVRETVREEMVRVAGGATRVIEEEAPPVEPVSVKRTRRDPPRARSTGPSKLIKN